MTLKGFCENGERVVKGENAIKEARHSTSVRPTSQLERLFLTRVAGSIIPFHLIQGVQETHS